MTIHFKDGFKYQITEYWEYDLQEDYYFDTNFTGWEHPLGFYGITWNGIDGFKIYGNPGCSYDGPTWCPDWKEFMEGSFGHDILCWLIERGVISEKFNDTIDREFYNINMERAPLPIIGGEWWLEKKCWLAMKATHLARSKKGKIKPVIIIETRKMK